MALLFFILSFILNWHHVERELCLSAAFVSSLAAHIGTISYFVPEQEGLISKAGYLQREVLEISAKRWISLNYLRIIAGVIGDFVLLLTLQRHWFHNQGQKLLLL